MNSSVTSRRVLGSRDHVQRAPMTAVILGIALALIGAMPSLGQGTPSAPAEGAVASLWLHAESAGALGMYRDETGQYVIAMPRTAGVLSPAGAGVSYRVKSSRWAAEEVEALQAQLARRDWHPLAAKTSFASHFDTVTDRLVIATESPELFHGLASVHADVEVRPASSVTREGREDDSAPTTVGQRCPTRPGHRGAAQGLR